MRYLFLYAALFMSTFANANSRCDYEWKNLKGTVQVTSKESGTAIIETCAAEIMIQDTSPCPGKAELIAETTFHCPSGVYRPVNIWGVIKGQELWAAEPGESTQSQVGVYTNDRIRFWSGLETFEITNLNSTSRVDFKYEASGCGYICVNKTATGQFSAD